MRNHLHSSLWGASSVGSGVVHAGTRPLLRYLPAHASAPTAVPPQLFVGTSAASSSSCNVSARKSRVFLGGHDEQTPAPYCNFHQIRTVIKHPARIVMGHKMEIIKGNQKTGKLSTMPKYPSHPSDPDRNMNLLTQYADMKLRWKYTNRWNNKRWKIARKWHPIKNEFPQPAPTCSFIWHNQMPITNGNVQQVSGEIPPSPEHFEDVEAMFSSTTAGADPDADEGLYNHQTKSGLRMMQDHIAKNQQDLFAIFKSNIYLQHKVTIGDLVQTEKLRMRRAGEKVIFGTVLFVGGRSFSIIGKPTVPYARVHCTIEQQTLAGEKLVFRCGTNNNRWSMFWRRRQYVTMLRVDKIEVDAENVHYLNEPVPKPDRLLDVWSNRFLTEEEKSLIPRDPVTNEPDAAKFYDGSEHQPGNYHNRGMTEAYRFWPDPGHSHWME
ncbi:unnamed protein product [Amoebophrya sp. A120]|nr:unnamed protein product [Amoebophrya sp. A120]|eukprot:GSA120T00022696001.1